MSTWPAGSFCLCCFWQVVTCLWSLNISGIPHHTDLHPDRNVYRGNYTCLGSPITRTSTLVGMSTRQAISFCLCCFSQVVRHLWSLNMSGIHPHTTSTLEGTSIRPAGSFCLCCFSQVVRQLCSLHVSWIQCHVDLHSSSYVYPTSCFILSVLFLTGGEMSVVYNCVQEPPLHRSPSH